MFFVFVLSVTPFVLIILTKYIIYGKFYIFKIEEEKILKEEGMSLEEYQSMKRKELSDEILKQVIESPLPKDDKVND